MAAEALASSLKIKKNFSSVAHFGATNPFLACIGERVIPHHKQKGVYGMYEKLLIALLTFANEQLLDYLNQEEPSEGELRLLNKLLEVKE